jgi:hypothetical protein
VGPAASKARIENGETTREAGPGLRIWILSYGSLDSDVGVVEMSGVWEAVGSIVVVARFPDPGVNVGEAGNVVVGSGVSDDTTP